MIVSSRDDEVLLSGTLNKNEWLTIKALAKLLLQQRPEGIVIDGSELGDVSEEGVKTFLDAMRDIQSEGARMIVSNLPENVMKVIRSVPGVRSQLPIANSVEEARASLRLSASAPAVGVERGQPTNDVLVPVLDDLDVEYGIYVAGRIAREQRAQIHGVYLLEVARNLPLGTPLAEEETTAHRLLEVAAREARRLNAAFFGHVERVRDAEEGLLQVIKNYRVAHVVLSGSTDHEEGDRFHNMVEALLHRAPCNVLIARKAPTTLPSGQTVVPSGRRGESGLRPPTSLSRNEKTG